MAPKSKKSKSDPKEKKEKIDENQLMNLMEKHKVLEISNPQQRCDVWEKITVEYNGKNQTNFLKDQITAKYQNYKAALKRVQSRHTTSVKKTGDFTEIIALIS